MKTLLFLAAALASFGGLAQNLPGEVARFIEDLTASYQAGWYSVISLHGGGSPEAMKKEIWRHYPVRDKVELVERLLERGVLADGTRRLSRQRQPGRCCAEGCTVHLPSPGSAGINEFPSPTRREGALRNSQLPNSPSPRGRGLGGGGEQLHRKPQ